MNNCIHLIKRQEHITSMGGYTKQIEVCKCSKGHSFCMIWRVLSRLCPLYVELDRRGRLWVEFYSPNDPFITEK
jgi:hypothetical protein